MDILTFLLKIKSYRFKGLKMFGRYTIYILLMFTVTFSCKNEPSSPSDFEEPILSISYPANNSEFEEGAVIPIKAEAFDNEGVEKVEFIINDELKDNDYIEPYQYLWNTNGEIGSHIIKVTAYDINGNSSEPQIISIRIYKIADYYPLEQGNIWKYNYERWNLYEGGVSGTIIKGEKTWELYAIQHWQNFTVYVIREYFEGVKIRLYALIGDTVQISSDASRLNIVEDGTSNLEFSYDVNEANQQLKLSIPSIKRFQTTQLDSAITINTFLTPYGETNATFSENIGLIELVSGYSFGNNPYGWSLHLIEYHTN